MRKVEWEPVTAQALAQFLIGLALFLVLVWRCEPGFIWPLDYANLLFHEAGHPIVGLFSGRLEVYGGTLGQMVFPCVVAAGCWRRGQPLGFAAAGVWLFENWLNIARYMADARAMVLPLVGGGDHDWNTIFSRWDVLEYDTLIAGSLRVLAWTGIAASCLWVLWHAWRDRKRQFQVQSPCAC